MKLKDLGRPIAFLAKMIIQQPLAAQLVSKGLLDPNRWRRLLDKSSPKEVTMDVVMIVLDLARMDNALVLCIMGVKMNRLSFLCFGLMRNLRSLLIR
ncbi:hypothetical protein UlMin_042754 [Ulmus minor]